MDIKVSTMISALAHRPVYLRSSSFSSVLITKALIYTEMPLCLCVKSKNKKSAHLKHLNALKETFLPHNNLEMTAFQSECDHNAITVLSYGCGLLYLIRATGVTHSVGQPA